MREIGGVSGRQYKKRRPKGFKPWKPQAKTRVVLDQMLEVIDTYNWPLTVRQILYRLVATYDFPKTESGYELIGGYANRARRSGVIPWHAIRDDIEGGGVGGYESLSEYLEGLISQIDAYERRPVYDRWVEVWVEAAGMVTQIEDVTDSLFVATVASGGFASITAHYYSSRRLLRKTRQFPKPPVVFLIGDYDPSGQTIMDVAVDEAKGFGAEEVTFVQLAVTPAQAEVYGLPSKPQKEKDRRGEHMAETWQVEALDPDVIDQIVRDAVVELLPDGPRIKAQRQTEIERAELRRILGEIEDTRDE